MKTSADQIQEYQAMQAHPERYSDEQIQAMIDVVDQVPDVEAEWNRFEQKHGKPVSTTPHYALPRWSRRAASVLIIVATVGLLYAAAVSTGLLPSPFALQPDRKVSPMSMAGANEADIPLQAEVKVYDNVALSQILAEIADYYHVSISYENVSVQTMRLFFRWDKSLSIEQTVQALNSFERIRIVARDSKTLVVE